MKVSKFWMDDYKQNKLYRITLGDLVTQRSTQPDSKEQDLGIKTGSIGFFDLAIRRMKIEGSEQFAPCILRIGVEPQYRGSGYGSILLDEAEKSAKEWGYNILAFDLLFGSEDTPAELIRKMAEHKGYTLYRRGISGYRQLE